MIGAAIIAFSALIVIALIVIALAARRPAPRLPPPDRAAARDCFSMHSR